MNSILEKQIFKVLQLIWKTDGRYIKNSISMREDFKKDPFKVYSQYDTLKKVRIYLNITMNYVEDVLGLAKEI